MKKKEVIKFRTSKKVKDQIKSKAKKSNLSISEYCRKCSLNKKIYDIESLVLNKKYINEINKIGTNLNQIARVWNIVAKDFSDVNQKELIDIYKETIMIFKQLKKLKQEIK
jgi:hypothetical protein